MSWTKYHMGNRSGLQMPYMKHSLDSKLLRKLGLQLSIFRYEYVSLCCSATAHRQGEDISDLAWLKLSAAYTYNQNRKPTINKSLRNIAYLCFPLLNYSFLRHDLKIKFKKQIKASFSLEVLIKSFTFTFRKCYNYKCKVVMNLKKSNSVEQTCTLANFIYQTKSIYEWISPKHKFISTTAEFRL